jgi:ketosteroid isomerase-like protein
LKEMTEQNVELARRGYEALLRGDVNAVYELLDPDLNWQGWEPGEGDCHNRAEAMSVIKERLNERAIGELEEIIDIDDERIIVVTSGNRDFEQRHAELGLPEGHDEIASVITIREGKVVQMRDHRSKAEALAAASEESNGV